MEARILKTDGTLGKKIYTVNVPADVYPIRRRLKKTMVAVGRWRNTNEPFFAVVTWKYNSFFSVELLKEIIKWMKRVKEED